MLLAQVRFIKRSFLHYVYNIINYSQVHSADKRAVHLPAGDSLCSLCNLFPQVVHSCKFPPRFEVIFHLAATLWIIFIQKSIKLCRNDAAAVPASSDSTWRKDPGPSVFI